MADRSGRKDPFVVSTTSSPHQIKKIMFKFTNPFKKPPAKVFAQDTLEEYLHQHIVSKEASEYHAKMAEFYKQGIQRMHTFVGSEPAGLTSSVLGK